MAKTNSGKQSESDVQTALKAINAPYFDWCRLYDATSARGAFMSQVGDFLFFLPGVHGVLEVKSTQHPYRLSKAAFSDNQRAKLKKRLDAGGRVFVLVHHYTENIWRVVPFNQCYEAFVLRKESSIDLRGIEGVSTASEALLEILEGVTK